MNDALHFGRLLRSLRESAGLSRAKLAKLTWISKTPISAATIKLAENSDRFPSSRVLFALIHVRELGLAPELLFKRYGGRFIQSLDPEMMETEFDYYTRVRITITLIVRK